MSLSFPKNSLIALRWESKYVTVSASGSVTPIDKSTYSYQPSHMLRSNITTEECPRFQDSIVLKSVYGKYMKLVQNNGYMVPEFRETNPMNATPVMAIPLGEGVIVFGAKELDNYRSRYIKWFADFGVGDHLSWEPLLGDIYSAFSNSKGTAYVTCKDFLPVTLQEAQLSFECSFSVVKIVNGKVLIKPYYGGYLGRDVVDSKIKVFNNVKDDYNAIRCPYLTFSYIKIDNDRVVLMADNLHYVKPDGGFLRAYSREIDDSCVFRVTNFSAEQKYTPMSNSIYSFK